MFCVKLTNFEIIADRKEYCKIKRKYMVRLKIEIESRRRRCTRLAMPERMLQPPAFRSIVIHTFRGNHDATVIRFDYPVRRNSQESRGLGARSGVTISQCFLSNYERNSRVQGIRDSRSDKRTIFTPRG